MSPAGGDQRRDRRGKNGSALGRFLTFLACAAGAAGLFLTGVAAGIWFSMPVPEAARSSVPHAAAAVPAAAPTSPVPAVSAPRTSQSPLPPPVATATRVPFDRRDDHRPLIAIVIDDMGVVRRRSDRAAALPGPLTLAFLPYAENVARQSHAARRRGQEIWGHIPMQPMGFNSDPGPNVLDARLGAAEMRRRLMWNLTRFDGYVGFNNHMGSRLTANRDAMDQVMTAAGARGLMFLDSL
ncbi:MAG: divergent polysaccharide deacetylase family protein, partial [Pseudomonadota bacterium]|nr:divergent polysaccharide deacetylase family protein [Pseudomonadota bacterium]